MSATTEIPWVYLCLKVQYACPHMGARLALGLPHAWPANDVAASTLPRPAGATDPLRDAALA